MSMPPAFTPPGHNNYPQPPPQPPSQPPSEPQSHPHLHAPPGPDGAESLSVHQQHHSLPIAHPYATPFDSHPQSQSPSQLQAAQAQALTQLQLQAQQQQQHPPQPPPPQHHSPYGNGPPVELHAHIPQGQAGATSAAGGDGQKGNRLRKACDSCSTRKVKCDESGPPCRACAALEIPCTRDRPSRRRGPPNRHAEAIKKRRLESPSAPPQGGVGNLSSPASPNNVAATLASLSSHAVLNAESICPFSTLELLVDDFFTYIHPLCPFPHEPSFRIAFKQREDLNNPSFLALLASMVGTLVASFPRKPRLHLKAQSREHLFQNSINLVERCHKVAVEARGPGYLDRELTVYDAATSYFLGLSAAYTFQWRQCRLYFGETLTIARVLGAHKVKNPGLLAIGSLPTAFGAEGGRFDGQAQPVDYIRQEIGRRIFWIMFVGIRSMQQLGASFGELYIAPPTINEPYPPFPMEVDDEYIFLDHVDPQPADIISKLTGFNLGIRIYLTVNPLATMEMTYGNDPIFDWTKQKRALEECLKSVKQVLDVIPHELLLRPGSTPGGFESPTHRYFPPVSDIPGARSNGTDVHNWPENATDVRRNLQYEIQKANIYASQLSTRSYIVEKYWNLHESYQHVKWNVGDSTTPKSPGLTATSLDGMLPKEPGSEILDTVEANVAAERESIVKDLLQVLGSISQVNMEPNGASFINKIRQIASTLISTPQNRKGPFALKAEDYLAKFLEVLMRLERISPTLKNESAGADEEEELRSWADLRDYQMRFAQAGGFINEIG